MGDKKTEVLNVHQRVNRIMGEIDYIKKDKSINFGRGSGYTVVGHDAVTRLIHPLLVKYGVNLIPTTKSIIQEGNRTKVSIEFRWVNVDNPEDHFITEASGYGICQQDKGIGKGWSVAQRFMVLKLFHLETGDKDIEDDDIDHVEETGRVKEAQIVEEFIGEVEERISAEDQQELMKMMDSLGLEVSDVIEAVKELGYEKSSEIPVSKLATLKRELIARSKGVANATS